MENRQNLRRAAGNPANVTPKCVLCRHLTVADRAQYRTLALPGSSWFEFDIRKVGKHHALAADFVPALGMLEAEEKLVGQQNRLPHPAPHGALVGFFLERFDGGANDLNRLSPVVCHLQPLEDVRVFPGSSIVDLDR